MTVPVKILIVEDQSTLAETCKTEILKCLPTAQISIELDFKKAPATVTSVSPDAVVLDLYDDALAAEGAGNPVWRLIWTQRFCPLVFHSAHEPPAEPAVPANHPFVKFVKKRPGSDHEVGTNLQNFLPHISAVKVVFDDLASVFHVALKDVAAVVWQTNASEANRTDALKRTTRRRVAACMDGKSTEDASPILAWEKYIIPVLSPYPKACDVIRCAAGGKLDPTAFRVILTPSCDMVNTQQQPCRLTSVLAAKCFGIDKYVTKNGVQNAGEAKIRAKLAERLSDGLVGGTIPLPEYPGLIPHMCADFKDLELIPYTSIGADQPPGYVRVASIDSPFREQMIWAYLQVACRPGAPDRDFEKWAADIAMSVRQSAK